MTGGLGTWLYAAAGLRFRVGVSGGGTGATGSTAAAAIAASHLGFDPRSRAGLSDAAAAAAVGVAAELRAGAPAAWAAGGSLPRARALLLARGVPEEAPGGRPQLSYTLTAFPPGAVVLQVGEGAAWHATPSGRASVAWAWRAPAFTLNVSLPPGVEGRVALPVAVLREAAGGGGGGGGGCARVAATRTASGAHAPLLLGALRLGAPTAGCAPLGEVEGVSWAWCAEGGGAAPRVVGWAEAEGEGRLRGGAPGNADGALLFGVEGGAAYTVEVAPCAEATLL